MIQAIFYAPCFLMAGLFIAATLAIALSTNPNNGDALRAREDEHG